MFTFKEFCNNKLKSINLDKSIISIGTSYFNHTVKFYFVWLDNVKLFDIKLLASHFYVKT